MITAGRENPNHGATLPRNRAHGAARQNRSRSIKWAAKQEKFQPKELCFFLTSPFIELTRHLKKAELWNVMDKVSNCIGDLRWCDEVESLWALALWGWPWASLRRRFGHG